MSLDRLRRQGDPPHPGEPGIGGELPPPYCAPDEATRWLFALNRFGIRPGLARIKGLLADLGHPERELRTLVIAGTNGKGSTTCALSHLLQAAGHRTVTYTSPHLLQVHERILLEGRPVAAAEFAARVRDIRPLVDKHQASWFESLTALAVQLAREAEVDFLCCETGLGGRLDASNALPAIATLLTTVGLDHQRILGDTRGAIAAEKLGLLKHGTPLFCGVDEELRAQVFTAAVRAGSPCHFLDELARWDEQPDATAGWALTLRERRFAGLPDPGTAALRRNVALALLTLTELEKSLATELLPQDPASALGNLFLPGRYQIVLRRPDWICDTAHNGQALAEVLAAFTGTAAPGRRCVLFGAMHDKAAAAVDMTALGSCDHLLGVPLSLPRSRTPDELAALFTGWGRAVTTWPRDAESRLPGTTVAPDLGAALRRLARELRPEDRVLVTGSCFTVAEVLHRLGFVDLGETRHPQPAPEVLARLAENDRPRAEADRSGQGKSNQGKENL